MEKELIEKIIETVLDHVQLQETMFDEKPDIEIDDWDSCISDIEALLFDEEDDDFEEEDMIDREIEEWKEKKFEDKVASDEQERADAIFDSLRKDGEIKEEP